MATTPEFFEEDEPVEKIVLAFEAGEKGFTTRPAEPPRGWTQYLRLPDFGLAKTVREFPNKSAGLRVQH
jgi:hypothetical protein